MRQNYPVNTQMLVRACRLSCVAYRKPSTDFVTLTPQIPTHDATDRS